MLYYYNIILLYDNVNSSTGNISWTQNDYSNGFVANDLGSPITISFNESYQNNGWTDFTNETFKYLYPQILIVFL